MGKLANTVLRLNNYITYYGTGYADEYVNTMCDHLIESVHKEMHTEGITLRASGLTAGVFSDRIRIICP